MGCNSADSPVADMDEPNLARTVYESVFSGRSRREGPGVEYDMSREIEQLDLPILTALL
jgi:hypothetical protein